MKPKNSGYQRKEAFIEFMKSEKSGCARKESFIKQMKPRVLDYPSKKAFILPPPYKKAPTWLDTCWCS
jgi:hypothetical protein